MDKSQDVFFEIVLRNSEHILTEAHYQKENQNRCLRYRKSNDHTADAALDNIYGGRITIDSNGEIRQLRNVQAWANIIGSLRMKYRQQKDQFLFNVFQCSYMERRTTRDCLRILRTSREKFFAAKKEIKNFVCAAACEMGIWKVL